VLLGVAASAREVTTAAITNGHASMLAFAEPTSRAQAELDLTYLRKGACVSS
jgi:hypothetical protein